MHYAIKIDKRCWKDYSEDDAYPWTYDHNRAKTWNQRSIPEKIIKYWNSVHHLQNATSTATALGGITPINATIEEIENANMSIETQLGCVGVYTDEQGQVIASVSDFDKTGYGGFSLYAGQKIRAQRALVIAVVDAYCSKVIMDALDSYDCEQIVRKLKGKMTFIPVGHVNEK